MCQIKNKGGKKFTGQDIMPISRVSLLTKGKGDFVLYAYISFSVPEIMDSNELLVDVGKADVFLYLSWSKHTAAVRTAV